MENTFKMSFLNVSQNVTVNGDNEVELLLQKVMKIILIALMAVIMLSLGCTIEIVTLKKELRRPVGICIGMLCQFILFPPITFGFAHALKLQKWDALGMIILGTCPGGSFSNVATYWSAGDVALSVSMTAASTTIGTGMMPLNLWIYSRSWTTQAAVIPYKSIVIALISILVPVAMGMVILVKFPKAAKWITLVGSTLGFIVILAAVAVGGILHPEMFTSHWKVWIGAAVLPNIGLLVGFLFSWLTRRSFVQRKAIAIETSAQNVALCLALISISFDKEVSSKIILYPSLFGIFSVVSLLLISLIFRIVDFRDKRKEILLDVLQKDSLII